jgi:hypothetical protein
MAKEYVISKTESRTEFRIYTENSKNIEGKIIFQGHKLSVENNLLEQIIEIKIDRGSGSIYTPDYQKPNDTIDLKGWFSGRGDSLQKNLQKSWETLKQKIEKELGGFRKITVTIVYI